MNEKLTIVTPTKNAADFIEENIEAIKKLPFKTEHILVDGGSSDDTLKIVNKYPKCTLLYQRDDKGMYSAIHQGFQEAKGEYICYVNADDKVVVDGYKKMYEEIQSGSYDLVYSDGCFYWQQEDRYEMVKGKRFGRFHLKNGLMPFLQPSSIYTKEIYFRVGGLDFNNFRICGDLDLFQQMALESGFKFKYLPVVSSIFLKYGDSLGDRNEYRAKLEKEKLYANRSHNFMNKMLFKISEFL